MKKETNFVGQYIIHIYFLGLHTNLVQLIIQTLKLKLKAFMVLTIILHPEYLLELILIKHMCFLVKLEASLYLNGPSNMIKL